MLIGAEPFRHPQLPSVVAAARSAGCQRIGVETDAVALRSEQNAHGSISAGVRHLRVRILAGTPGLHDALVGTPGALDASMLGVDTFRACAASADLPVDTVAEIPLCRHNVHDAPTAVGLAAQHGFDRVVLRVADAGIGIASSMPWVRAACDTGVVNGVWVEVDGLPFCVLTGHEMHVADLLSERAGAKSPACGACALDDLCGGAAAGTAPDQLSDLDPSRIDARRAERVARARGAR
jgi:MoaA/NifB/PqqE/SkfB family radical SAM enzyme